MHRLSITLVASVLSILGAESLATEIFAPNTSFLLVEDGEVWDVYTAGGYAFYATRDKLFTGGLPGGEPIGRDLDIELPQGLEAQALSVLPPSVGDNKARIEISRVDGQAFDLNAFTMMMLWTQTNPIETLYEIMPIYNDEDAFDEPIRFYGTGHYGDTFHYDQTSVPTNTSLFVGYHAYKIKFLLDFAMISLEVAGPACPADLNADGAIDFFDVSAFLSAYQSQSPGADFTGDGMFDFFDVSAFLSAYTAGCP